MTAPQDLQPPSMVVAMRVDRWYRVAAKPAMKSSSTRDIWFDPHTVQTIQVYDGSELTVVVSGGIINRSTGAVSERVAKTSFGTFGLALDEAPAWVREIAATAADAR